MAIAHKDIPEAGLHEPKGVSTAAAGTVYVADGAGSGAWEDPIPTDLVRVGWGNYHDYATGITPQAISATTWTKLTNDALGSLTDETYLPTGVTTLWDSVNDQFDFTDLPLGSTVDLRFDIEVTTSGANQYVALRLVLGESDPSEYTLGVSDIHYKTAGTYNVVHYTGIYIGNTITKDNPGQLEIYSDATCDVVVNGFYVRVHKVNA